MEKPKNRLFYDVQQKPKNGLLCCPAKTQNFFYLMIPLETFIKNFFWTIFFKKHFFPSTFAALHAMCIRVTEKLVPSETKLLTVCLNKDLIGKCSQYITYYANRLDPVADKTDKQVMVVPFPHEHQSPIQVKMAELPHATLEQRLWETLDVALPMKAHPRSRGLVTNGKCKKEFRSLAPVVQAGGYKISLVTSFVDLQETVNWAEFHLPANFEALMTDLEHRFGLNYGFVVAEPNLNPADGRLGGLFAWVWYGYEAFLPTAHEAGADLTDYDVTGIVLNEPLMTGLAWDSTHQDIPEHPTRFYIQENAGSRDYAPVLDILNATQIFLPNAPDARQRIAVSNILHAARFDFRGRHPVNANMVATTLALSESSEDEVVGVMGNWTPSPSPPSTLLPNCVSDCVLF